MVHSVNNSNRIGVANSDYLTSLSAVVFVFSDFRNTFNIFLHQVDGTILTYFPSLSKNFSVFKFYLVFCPHLFSFTVLLPLSKLNQGNKNKLSTKKKINKKRQSRERVLAEKGKK